jgi:hypothetical protein
MATKKNKARTTHAARPQRAPRSTRPAKPIFGMATWIMLLLFAGLISVVFILKNQKATADAAATPTSETKFVFDVSAGTPMRIEVQPADGDAVKVVRNTENVWVMELPIKTEANQAAVEAAATQISSLRVVGEVDDDPEIFGLDNPAHTITVEFSSGEKHTLAVGDSTPTFSGYYVQLDKGRIMIVGLSGIDSILNLAFFPPYLNTPTSTPLPPTETPVGPSQTPTPEAGKP